MISVNRTCFLAVYIILNSRVFAQIAVYVSFLYEACDIVSFLAGMSPVS